MSARFCLALIAAGTALLSLAPAASALAADQRTRLKVCAYNVEGRAEVRVDGRGFARFPRDGSCETDQVAPGTHKLDAGAGASSFESGEVIQAGGGRDVFYNLPRTVRVERGEQTRVNLYFF